MKIFLDSADLDEIKQAYSYGIIDGVTTNPSLIKQAVDVRVASGTKINMREYVKEILKVAKGTPVSLEVTETSEAGMLRQARKIYKMFNQVAKNVIVKIPVNPTFNGHDVHFDGLKVIKQLSKEKIPVNCTLIFTPEQALLAAKAGAKYVSPFAGRIDDFIRIDNKIKFEKSDYFPAEGIEKKNDILDDNGIISGVDLVSQIVDVLKEYKTEVLAASTRNPRQVRECALVGADIATLPFGVIQEMNKHFKTEEGMQKFTKDIVMEYMDLLK
jgi:transaldolase